MYKVYIRENIINHKKYCGVTKQTLEARAGYNGMNYVYWTPNTPFAKAISKYGWDNFKSYVVKEFENHKEALNFETETILELKLTDQAFGYNTIEKTFGEVASHTGSKNGMFGNGYKLSNGKNGRARKTTIIYPNGSTISFDTQKQCREFLNISKDLFISMRKSEKPFTFSNMTNKDKILKNKHVIGLQIKQY